MERRYDETKVFFFSSVLRFRIARRKKKESSKCLEILMLVVSI